MLSHKEILRRKRLRTHPSHLGIPHSEKTKRILSEKAKLRTGINSTHWHGGRMMIGGYWYILSPGHPNKTQMGYVAEHRLMIEKKIGRFLTAQEVVHHINGIKTDNLESNLVMCQSQSEHANHHNKPRNKKGRFYC
jgi:hypothetical protein